MTQRAPMPEIDLLAWPAVAAARAECEAAEAARVMAERKWRLAPHGQVQTRLKAFQEATLRALKAQAALTELTSGAVH